MHSPGRNFLAAAVRYSGIFAGLAVVYVLLDFMIDARPPQVQESYRFRVGELLPDRPGILRQDNLSIVIINRSEDTIARLAQASAGLQDPDSQDSHQPGFALNPLRSKHPEWFVSYAIGTHLGCGLEVVAAGLGEICSSATYDYAGRARQGGDRFQNLAVPDYTFSDDFKFLTIWP